MNGCPECVLDEEMLTIRPQPASIMSGSTAWTQWKTPFRLTSTTCCQSSKVMSVNRLKRSSPAAFTRIVTGPSCSRTAFSAASTAARSVTSAVYANFVVGRIEVEGGDVIAVGAQPVRDGLADARAASGDDGGLHATAPVSCHQESSFRL